MYQKPTIPIIAVTGSAGKTTIKEMLSEVLETKWKVFKSIENKNQPYNTKKNAELIESNHQAAVLEFGLGRKNAGEKHCKYIQPNISIISNVGHSHFGMLGNSIEKTIKAKSALIKYMNPHGLLVINKDDYNSSLLKFDDFKGKIITVGVKNRSSYQAINIRYLKDGMGFQVILDGNIEYFTIKTFGYHNVINALFAIAVAHQMKFSSSDIRLGLSRYQTPKRRLNLIKLKNGILLIDDTYNSNPEASMAAIDVLVQLSTGKNKIAVMGSMLELGDYAIKGHKNVGRYLALNNFNTIFTYGKKAKWIGKGAVLGGMSPSRVFSFTKRNLLHASLLNALKPNTIILIKGSNKKNMNKTVDFLVNNFSNGVKRK